MATELVLPKLGDVMEEGILVKWLKSNGERVNKDEPVFEIETEKLVFEVPANAAGIVHQLTLEGATVKVGDRIAWLLGEGEAAPGAEPPHQAVPVESSSQDAPEAEKPTAAVGKSIPLTSMRKVVGDRMMNSLREMAQLTMTTEVDVDKLQELRSALLKSADFRGCTLTYTDFIHKAVALALCQHPIVNGRVAGDHIDLHEGVNLGMAVATEEGLLVPVIHHADDKALKELARDREDLAEKANERKLSLDEVSGSTFTVTNLGMYGVEIFTPIINPPEVAILGVGNMSKRLALKDGHIVENSIMHLSLSWDHRAFDGAPAAMFLRQVKELLEDGRQLE